MRDSEVSDARLDRRPISYEFDEARDRSVHLAGDAEESRLRPRVGSFTYTSHGGIRSLFILEVEDEHLAEYIVTQSERTVHMQSRIPEFNVEIQIGQSVQDGIATALRQLPK